MVRLSKNIDLLVFFVFVWCRCVETDNGALHVCEEYNIITLAASLQETFTYKICIKTQTNTPQVFLVIDKIKSYLVDNSTKYALSYTRNPEQNGPGALTLEIANITVSDFVQYKIVSVVAGIEDVIFTINLVHSGCPENWCSVEQGRCLLVIKENASCTEAKEICVSNKGSLYDGTFNYRSRHCSRMKELMTLGGTECSTEKNGSQTENAAHLSHFACFRDLTTPPYNNSHVFQDIKYLWIGVGLMFLSLMAFQIIAHRRLMLNRAADGLANKRRIHGKLESIFYWDSSRVSGTQTAGDNDSIELLDFKDHSDVVEGIQSCEQDTYYEIINQESKVNPGETCLRTMDGAGRGNHVTNIAFASGIYAVISERFNSQRSLDRFISDPRERDVPVREHSAETLDCRNPEVQLEALSLKSMNKHAVQCNQAPLIDIGARIKPKYRKFSNVVVSDKIKGDEGPRNPSAGHHYIKKSKNASQFSHFGEIVKVNVEKLYSVDGFTENVHDDVLACASRSDITDNLLSGHEVTIDGAFEEVYSMPELFSEDHDYGTLTGDTLETRHGDCLRRNKYGSSRYESDEHVGGHVKLGFDLPLGKHCDVVIAETQTPDFVMPVPVEGKCVLSDDEISGQHTDADAEIADEYWVPDGYGDQISELNFYEFNEHSMVAGEEQA